jgi:hypothetical protein
MTSCLSGSANTLLTCRPKFVWQTLESVDSLDDSDDKDANNCKVIVGREGDLIQVHEFPGLGNWVSRLVGVQRESTRFISLSDHVL